MFVPCWENSGGKKRKEGRKTQKLPSLSSEGREEEEEGGGVGREETCGLGPGKVFENANSVPADSTPEGQVLVIGLLEKQQSRNKNRSLTKNIPFQPRSFKVLLPIFLFKKL